MVEDGETKLRQLACEVLGDQHLSALGKPDLQPLHRVLKSSGLDKVNQFAIDERLRGLEERWQIMLDEEHAEQLSTRLLSLRNLEEQNQYQFLPECLQLLLSLTDGRPAANFDELLKELHNDKHLVAVQAEEEDLSLARPGSPDIWRDIDYDSPDSDGSGSSIARTSQSKRISVLLQSKVVSDIGSTISLNKGDLLALGLPDAGEEVDNIRTTRQRQSQCGRNGSQVSSALFLRETIYMLSGMNTCLYGKGTSGIPVALGKVRIQGLTFDASQSIIYSFVASGTIMQQAREIMASQESLPVLQTYQTHVQNQILNFHKMLSKLESAAVDPNVQLNSILTLSKESAAFLDILRPLLPAFPSNSLDEVGRDVLLLDRLLETVDFHETLSKSVASKSVDLLESCFSNCLEVYWRPVQAWLDFLNSRCEGMPFVRPRDNGLVNLQQFWKGCYELRPERAPIFLRSFLPLIYTAGRSTAMLALLSPKSLNEWAQDKNLYALHHGQFQLRSRNEFETLAHRLQQELNSLCQKYATARQTPLLQTLSEQWGLWEELELLRVMYLGEGGRIINDAHSALFTLLDQGRRWEDKFVLAEIYQASLRVNSDSDSDKISVVLKQSDRIRSARQRSLVKLECFRLKVSLTWPIANIIDATSEETLQRVSALTRQISRARWCLDQYVTHWRGLHTLHSDREPLHFSLHHRLRWFVNTFHGFLALDVFPAAASSLSQHTTPSTNLEAMITDFCKSTGALERGCLLAKSQETTHQAIVSILDLAVTLADSIFKSGVSNTDEDDRYGLQDDIDDDSNTLYQAKGSETAFRELSIPEKSKLLELHSTYRELLAFVHAGVKESGRVFGDIRLELFANDLSHGLGVLKL